jgi:glyoxylase-like metal-dependent hydrolase (beta-lactamase superfamily II)
VDLTLRDGDRIACGSYGIRVWHVPGHCPDHLAFLVEETAAGLTGDLLFVGKIGGTASDRDARVEWESLQRLLEAWPAHTTLWPGHDYGSRPSSTLDWERRFNPFLQCPEIEAFLQLKRDWSPFKARHGLR